MRSPLKSIPLLLFALYGVASLSGVSFEADTRKIDPYLQSSMGTDLIETRIRHLAAPSDTTPFLLPAFLSLGSGDPAIPAKIMNLEGTSLRITDRLFIVHVPIDAIDYISRWGSVDYIEGGKLARPLLDVSRNATSADRVQAGNSPLPRPFTGTGINVGIVDTGLNNAHKDFFDSSGTVSRVVHTYSASSFPSGTSPDPKVDEDGHGTHVTGIAAGNGLMSSGTYTGMAPGANLFIAKTNFLTTDIVTAVANLMKNSIGKPISMNLSFGVVTGPHDGTDDPQGSLFTKAINDLATNPPNGKGIIVAAAGNERTEKEHFQIPLPHFGSVSIPLSLKTGSSFIDVWADGADRYMVRATIGSDSAEAAPGKTASSSGNKISISNGGDLPLNGATHITVFFTSSAATPATIFLARTRNGGNGKVDAYIDKQEGSFTTGSEAGTITEPANAENIIAVGSYNTKIGGEVGPIGDISTFSSLGPTRDGRIKPDLTAPGSLIYSARSFDATFLPIEIAPNDNYVIFEGTSMSTPHVAGIAALIWESNPLLTSAQMRERLKRTADPQTTGPDTTWGHGKVNALAAVTETVAGISGSMKALRGENLTLRADEKSSGPYGNTVTYTWMVSGGTVTPLTGPSTTFTANTPGDYTVTLTATPGSEPYNSTSTTIRVNTIPVAKIDGPSTDNVGIPVSFSGAGSFDQDPGSPPLKLWWVLVSRPSDSSVVSLVPAGNDNATLTTDKPGIYEVGLRADDGLDNSALVTKIYTTTGVAPPSTGGGGGGCSIGSEMETEDGPSSLAALLLILIPLFVLPARKLGRSTSRCPGTYRGVPRSGLWNEEEIALCGMAASGRRSRAFDNGAPGIQRSVHDEAVHREGRCAPSGKTSGRGAPTAVR
jgi:minor extracellular serine protease Vpr